VLVNTDPVRHDEHGEQHHLAELPAGRDCRDEQAKRKAGQQNIKDDVRQGRGAGVEPPGERESRPGDYENRQQIR
jgi:hypothetical protein